MEEFDYCTLFKFAFPEWKGPIPALRVTFNEVCEDFEDPLIEVMKNIEEDNEEEMKNTEEDNEEEMKNTEEDKEEEMKNTEEDNEEEMKNIDETIQSSVEMSYTHDNEKSSEEKRNDETFGMQRSEDEEVIMTINPNKGETHFLESSSDNENSGIDFEDDRASIKVYLVEVISNAGHSNLCFQKQKNAKKYPHSIKSVILYAEDGSSNILENVEEDVIYIVPNLTWVFSLQNEFLEEASIIFDPFISRWLINTESFVDSDVIMPLSTIIKAISMEKSNILDVFLKDYNDFHDNYSDLFNWYTSVEVPHLRLIGHMHNYSFTLDTLGIKETKNMITNDIEEISQKIFELAGVKFNILSPFEVSDILFNKMGIKNPQESQKNRMLSIDSRHRITHHRNFAPTSGSVLDTIDHPIIPLIKKYRTLQKLTSNWLSFEERCDSDNKIHPWIEICSTATGRISTNSPNIMNIPATPVQVDEDHQINIRSFFLPYSDGNTLISIDYTQLELRILAHFSKDPVLVELCNRKDVDIHTLIATHLFTDDKHQNINEDNITPKMRNESKTAIYATIYGKQWGSNEGVTIKGIRMKNVLDTFKGVKEFISKTVTNSSKDGYVCSFSKKRRVLPNLKKTNFNSFSDKKRDERMCVNTVIQGSAADFVKFALLKIVKETNLKPIIQIHDEWIFETPNKIGSPEMEQTLDLLKRNAECAEEFGFTVPIPVKISVGSTYGDLQ